MADITPFPSDILVRVLCDLKVLSNPEENSSWPGYVNSEPDKPDNVVTIFDTEGTLQGRLQITGDQIERVGIQVRIRSQSPTPRKCSEIKNALDRSIRRTTVKVSGTTYTIDSVKRTSNIISIGKEPKTGLNLFTINALLTIS